MPVTSDTFRRISQHGLFGLSLKDSLIFAALFLALAIAPMLVRLYMFNPGADIQRLYYRPLFFDFFAYYKEVLLLIACMALLLLHLHTLGMRLIARTCFSGFTHALKTPYVLAALTFGVSVFLSMLGVDPEHRYTAWMGFFERYEGGLVQIGYMLILLTVISFVRAPLDGPIHSPTAPAPHALHAKPGAKSGTASNAQAAATQRLYLIFNLLIFSAIGIVLLGITQYNQNDFLFSPVGRVLSGMNTAQGVNFNIKFTQIYTSFGNPNYAGVYGAMMGLTLLLPALLLPFRSGYKYFLLLLSLLCFFMLIGAGSSSGLAGLLVGGFVVLVMAILLQGRGILHIPRRYLALVPLFLLLALAGTFFHTKTRDMLQAIAEKLLHPQPDTQTAFVQNLRFLTPQTLQLSTQKGTLTFQFDPRLVAQGSIAVRDSQDQPIPLIRQISEPPYTTRNEYHSAEMGNFFVKTGNGLFIFLLESPRLILAMRQQNDRLIVTNMRDLPMDPNAEIPQWGFAGYENFASARGYIWSRSLPLVQHRWLLGYGPDCFIYYFPQHDLVGKLRIFGDPYIIVDKVHSYYLSLLLNTGVVSLLAMLCLFAVYLVSTVRALLREPDSNPRRLGLRLGILGGVVCYLVAALANDSVLGIAPVFFALLGIGIAANHIGAFQPDRAAIGV